MKQRLFALAFALVLTLGLALPVLAHASLLRSSPEANATLGNAPAQVELVFSETLESSFSSIEVLDANGLRVDNNDSQVDPADLTRLTVSLHSLPDGVYTVSWKALSSTDGHATTGAYPFAVGNVDDAALAAAKQSSRQITLSLGEVLAKWLLYLAVAAITGGNLFILAVWQPTRDNTDDASLPWPQLTAGAIALALVAGVFGLLVQAGQASGTEIAAPWSTAVHSVLFTTRYGALWIARLALLLALAGTLPQAETVRRRWAAFGLSLALLLVISFSSHAAAESHPWLPVAADWIHLVAASAWVGGLVYLVAGLWATRKTEAAGRTRAAARLIPRFSALALTSVGVLALSGLYSAILRVGSWDALANTLYGRALIVKLTLLAPLIMLGAINLLVITPAMKRAAQTAAPSRLPLIFQRIVTSEVTLGAALLLAVGVLTSLPPARVAAPALTASTTEDDLRLSINISPGRVGVNTFTVHVTANGQPVDNAKEVVLRFTPALATVAPSEARLEPQGNGDYGLKGAFLSLPASWQVLAIVRRESKFDTFGNFHFAVGTPSAPSYPWNRVAGALLLVAALCYVFAFGTLGRTQTQLIAYGLVPAFALSLVSVGVFFGPSAADAQLAGVMNPVTPNAASVAAGKALFQTNCVPCHGASGKGDGPVGLTLSPRPADLTLHAVPGVHTDAQLFDWISNGFPGSVMPVFKNNISEQDRWNLVNFIRTLAPTK